MKVLLIKPPYTRLKGMGEPPYFPLGLGYVASVLNASGFEAMIYHAENPRRKEDFAILDAEVWSDFRSVEHERYHQAIADEGHHVWQEVRDTLRQFNPDLVGVSLLSMEVGSALRISRLCKEHDKDLPIVWGGVHPTLVYESSIRYPDVDYVLRGEGEYTMAELCRCLSGQGGDLDSIPGLVYKKAGEIKVNPLGAPIPDIDQIPFPARDRVLYPESLDFGTFGSMVISRGCPFNCTFCASRAFWGSKVRSRSPENLVREIKLLKETYGTRHIVFWDDTLSMSRPVTEKYCHALIDAKVRVTWQSATRADLIDEPLLDLMREAGCVKMEIGVESGSDRMKRLIRKDLTNEQILQAFKLMNRKGIGSGAFMITGFPEETAQDMDETWDLMKTLEAGEIHFNVFDPMPGTVEYQKCVDLGLLNPDEGWSRLRYWPEAHYVKDMSREEFSERFRSMARWVHARNRSTKYLLIRHKQQMLSLWRLDPKLLLTKTWGFIGRKANVWSVMRSGKKKRNKCPVVPPPEGP